VNIKTKYCFNGHDSKWNGQQLSSFMHMWTKIHFLMPATYCALITFNIPHNVPKWQVLCNSRDFYSQNLLFAQCVTWQIEPNTQSNHIGMRQPQIFLQLYQAITFQGKTMKMGLFSYVFRNWALYHIVFFLALLRKRNCLCSIKPIAKWVLAGPTTADCFISKQHLFEQTPVIWWETHVVAAEYLLLLDNVALMLYEISWHWWNMIKTTVYYADNIHAMYG
jgi:hypothetical protein